MLRAAPRLPGTPSTARQESIPFFLAGKLFCLYSEEFASKDMRPLKPAEVQEANLTSMVLFMKRIDIAGLGRCGLLNRPGSAGGERAGGQEGRA